MVICKLFKKMYDNLNTYPDLSSSISSMISFNALGLTFSAINDRIVPIVSTGIASSTQNPSKHFFKTEKSKVACGKKSK